MKKYEVSIVTPIHNTNLDIFKKTAQSMRDQTMGFENIEWVIVVHNSTEEYDRQIQEMFSADENVKVEILHNDAHTPSSPRNRGLEVATGDYVGFLDGDDKYTPECLRTALYHIKKTDSDVCLFRRSVELESDASMVLNERVLWDRTRDEIVVNRDTWDDKKLFCSVWGMVTNRLYRMEFVRKLGMRFDEELDFAEDFPFILTALWNAKNVCLLPQLIGYVYFVNSASMLQSMGNKGEETVLMVARSFKKVIDLCLSYGIDMNDTMHMFVMMVAGAMIARGKVSEPVRKEVFELMTPYAKLLKPLDTLQLYSQKYLDDLNTLPKYFLSGEDSSLDFSGEGLLAYDSRTLAETIQQFQQRALYHILDSGSNTDYGNRYHFSEIATMEGYLARLPMTNYDTYQPMVNLAAIINEEDIFTNEQIIGYTLSYGKIGVPKRLPATRKQLAPYLKEMERMLGGKKVFFMGEGLFYRSTVRNLDTKYTSTLTGILLTEFYNDNVRVSISRKRAEITTPAELLFPDKVMDLEYPRLFFALREKDINTIYAPNACMFMNSIQRLAKNWEQLCDDIEAGSISELKNFPEDKRSSLNTRIAPDPERAKELRKIFAASVDGNVLKLVKDIWPSLVEVIADGTGSYAIYADMIRENMRHVKYRNDFLATEEGFIGRAVPNTDMFELDLSSNFYEFVPLTLTGNVQPVMAHDLKVGEEYRVIVSGFSGLYRYSTNTLVRCEEIGEDSVTVSRLCPRDYDIASMESITEEDVYRAVQVFTRKSDIHVADFVFIYDDELETYSLVLEPADMGDNFARAEGMSQERRDELAVECAKVFATSRELKILFNEPGTHALHSEMIQYRRKILQDAVRPCHVIDNTLESKFFLKLTV